MINKIGKNKKTIAHKQLLLKWILIILASIFFLILGAILIVAVWLPYNEPLANALEQYLTALTPIVVALITLFVKKWQLDCGVEKSNEG